MAATNKLFRRCGCRDDAGRQYATLPDDATPEQRAKACPKMLEDPKHGRWSFMLSAGTDPITGKRVRVRGGTFATRREAASARTALEARKDARKPVRVDRVTFAEYLPPWLERHARVARGGRGLAPSSLSNYSRYVTRDIAPSALGRMQLGDIRRHHLNAYVDQLLADGRGEVTVRRIMAVVQAALRAAARDQRIPENPATDLDLPAAESEPPAPWEPEQVGAFLDAAAGHRLGALFELAVFTGLRRGELVGLRWDDVDLARRIVRVRRQRTIAGTDVVERATKTRAGLRVVDLSDAAAGALVAWQIAQGGERERWGEAWADTGYVFTYEDGQPLKPQYVTRLFDRLREAAGLPKMTLHGTRHAFVSLALASGADIALVSKLVGHSSVSVTADVYHHMIGRAGRDAANAAAGLVPRRGAGTTSAPHPGPDTAKAAPAEAGTAF